jgi:hypothetical protein
MFCRPLWWPSQKSCAKCSTIATVLFPASPDPPPAAFASVQRNTEASTEVLTSIGTLRGDGIGPPFSDIIFKVIILTPV